jgi:hypothetical protein
VDKLSTKKAIFREKSINNLAGENKGKVGTKNENGGNSSIRL